MIFHHQDANDPKIMAELQYPWLKKGHYYLKKDSSQVRQFEGMTVSYGVFFVLDLFGKKTREEVPHDDLKFYRQSPKDPELALSASLVSNLQPEKCEVLKLELEKAQVQAAVLQCYQEKGLLDSSWLHFTTQHRVLAAKKLKKTDFKIFPVGTVTKIKDERLDKIDPKCVVIVSTTGHKYQVMPCRVDLEKGTGALPAYFWVKAVDEEEDATLELDKVKYHPWLSIPFFKPKKPIDEGMVLSYYKPPEDGPKAKKAKKAQ